MKGPKSNFDQLIEIMAQLRGPEGCPWDREQTHKKLKPFLLEESYEVLDAIESGTDEDLVEELGDVLLQVVFHSQIGEEENRFTIDDVLEAIVDKLIRRHPHVFGDVKIEDADHVVTKWEQIKLAERNNNQEKLASALDGVPAELPALLRAQRVQEKASRIGFDWTEISGPLDKVSEEIEEFRHEISVACELIAGDKKKDNLSEHDFDRIEEEIGDLLFSLVNVGRFLGICCEDGLRIAINKFERRFLAVENKFRSEDRPMNELTLEEMDGAWNAIKEKEAGN